MIRVICRCLNLLVVFTVSEITLAVLHVHIFLAVVDLLTLLGTIQLHITLFGNLKFCCHGHEIL